MEMGRERVDLPRLVGYRCFACGTLNPIGLKMTFYRSGRAVCSDVTLNECHVGWENIVHGGIISTLLDETMSWAVIALKRKFFVTRSMDVRYLRPVAVDVPLSVVAEIEPEPLPNGCRAVGSLRDQKGKILAEARAEMVFLTEKRLEGLPLGYRQDMLKLFEQMERVMGG